VSPDQFLRDVAKGSIAPVYLFAGTEGYQRDQCRRALKKAILGEDEEGWTPHDLDQITLAEALDDARAMSLFASNRIIWVGGAENALPKRLTEDAGAEAAAELIAYLKNPTPGVVVVFDSRRFDFEGDDKARMDRVLKFYTPIKAQVEFRQVAPEVARNMAQEFSKKAGLQIGAGESALLTEACNGDVLRIHNEIEKLSLYAGTDRRITGDDLAALVANARTSTIFALVAAMGQGNRGKALEILDSLVREGEYLPMALMFVAGQFKYALIAHEAGLKNSMQITGHFTKLGIRMWRDRAEQVAQTVMSFPRAKAEKAVRLLATADRDLRDTRPDDRTVFENLILAMTA
jgi:DNA polymerase III subunit delta